MFMKIVGENASPYLEDLWGIVRGEGARVSGSKKHLLTRALGFLFRECEYLV